MKNKKKEILNEMKKNNGGFRTPVNYFNEFEKNFQKNETNVLTGYKTPKNYFSEVENKIIDRLKDLNETKITGFKIPDNYFNEFDNNLSKKIINKNTKIVGLYNYKYFKIISFSIAASLLLFFGLNNSLFDKNEYNIETIQVTEIENWMDEDLISFNSYDIAEAFSDVELVMEDDFSDEILEYLDYTDIENLILEN
jgi:hypothetical protein